MLVRRLIVTVGKFDRDASRYHAPVYQRKRLDLLTSLHASLSPLFLGQLKNLHKSVSARFAKDLNAGLKESGYDLAEVVQRGTAKARDTFLESAKGEYYQVFAELNSDANVEVTVEGTDWEYEHELALLEDDLRLIADQIRADETKKMVNATEVG